MTDHASLPDDELVSAFLDGELDEAGRARVEAEPALLARADELGRVRAVLGDPPQPPPGAVDTAVTAALAARTATPVEGPTVIDLEDRRRRRRRITTAVAAAAAVVVAIPVALRVASDTGSTTTADVASGAPTSVADSSEQVLAAEAPAADEVGEGEASAGAGDPGTRAESDLGATNEDGVAAPTTTTRPAGTTTATYLGDLGEHATSEDLADIVATSTATTTTVPDGVATTRTPPPAGVDVDTCAASVGAADPTLGALQHSAAATYQGTPVWVLVYADRDDASVRHLEVADRATCTVRLSRTI